MRRSMHFRELCSFSSSKSNFKIRGAVLLDKANFSYFSFYC